MWKFDQTSTLGVKVSIEVVSEFHIAQITKMLDVYMCLDTFIF
jgi:hypothetical protein